MTIRDSVPESLVEYFHTLLAKRRYPGSVIWSARIAPNAVIGSRCRIWHDVEVGPSATIGDYSYVNRGSIIASGRIGKFCSIGYYCQIGQQEHPVDYISTSPSTYGRNNLFHKRPVWNDFVDPPLVGNDVWIASAAQVLQGVTIGDGAIIAAGAIVTKDVPPYAIMGGVPARIIRYRFSSSEIDAILRLEWWNMSPVEIGQRSDLFGRADWDRYTATRTVGTNTTQSEACT